MSICRVKIDCRAGETQIGRILTHARKEHEKQKIGALVFVGDTTEESPDELATAAAALGVPTFMFHECDAEEVKHNQRAEKTFREIARLTGGAYCRFQPGSAEELGELLRAAAAYAAGGLSALTKLRSTGAALMIGQIRK